MSKLDISPSTIARISAAVRHARAKHPDPPLDENFWPVLIEELGELARAQFEALGAAKEHAETLDAIAVLVRKLEGW